MVIVKKDDYMEKMNKGKLYTLHINSLKIIYRQCTMKNYKYMFPELWF